MNLKFHIQFDHESGGHATTMVLGTIKEVKEAIETMKPTYKCSSLEVILDITEMIKNEKT